MFIKKSTYEEMVSKNKYMEEILKKQRLELEKYKSNEHNCDSMCEGCQHLIESKELRFSMESYYGTREYTTRKCALDRTCKDFKQKEEE